MSRQSNLGSMSQVRHQRRTLSRGFYRRDTSTVARELLGMILCVRKNGVVTRSRIVETEAYLGLSDEACHSFGGRPTPRTEVMYGDAGYAYVYFVYGMYFCFNVVTREKGCPEAVLIRAVEPEERLPTKKKDRKTNGPGKLCQALGITREDNGLDLCDSENALWIERGNLEIPDSDVIVDRRVGIDSKETARDLPLRFYVHSSEWVSKRK